MLRRDEEGNIELLHLAEGLDVETLRLVEGEI